MSTFAELREIVLLYLQQNVNLTDPFPGSAVSADAKAAMIDTAILRAANNARKRAERLNDWVLTQISSTATVPAGEAISLLGHTDAEDETVTFDYKNIVEVTSDGWPIHLAGELSRLRKKYMKARSCPRKVYGVSFNNHFRLKPACDEDEELKFYGHRWMDDYYLNDPDGSMVISGITTPLGSNGTLLAIEGEEYLWSTDGTEITAEEGTYVVMGPYNDVWSILVFVDGLETVRWVSVQERTTATDPSMANWVLGDDYTSGTGTPVVTAGAYSVQTDFFLQHGMDYMQWATIVECNHWAKVFVPRQEGNLAPPERERDRCLDELLRWDNNMLDAQTNFAAR